MREIKFRAWDRRKNQMNTGLKTVHPIEADFHER
jgi:hypothetical protein